MKDLPQYQCNKTVRACKIGALHIMSDGSGVIRSLDDAYQSFAVTAGYIAKHDPKPGGYFVQYEDGYASFSPADAFESGYTLMVRTV